MPSEVKIVAEPRTEFGKGAARRIRRADKVPAVLYEHGDEPIHISLPGHDLMLALKTPNALLSIEVDGTPRLAIPKQVQRDPIKGFLRHADLLLVRRGEKVVVDIPVELEGEAGPDTLVSLEHPQVSLEVEATHIPGSVDVSIEGLEAGTLIHARDLSLPAGSTLAMDEDIMIVNISNAPTAEELEAEVEEVEGELGVEHDEAEVPEAGAEAAPAEETEAGGSTEEE